jgi:hypothetical protein
MRQQKFNWVQISRTNDKFGNILMTQKKVQTRDHHDHGVILLKDSLEKVRKIFSSKNIWKKEVNRTYSSADDALIIFANCTKNRCEWPLNPQVWFDCSKIRKMVVSCYVIRTNYSYFLESKSCNSWNYVTC